MYSTSTDSALLQLKPYYQDSLCSLYCADCRDVLQEVAVHDLLITDPPYGISYSSHGGLQKYWRKSTFGKMQGDTGFPIDLLLSIPFKSAAYIFCRWSNVISLSIKPKSIIAWVKNRWTAGDLGHEHGKQWESILFYPGESHAWRDGRPRDVVVEPSPHNVGLFHPTQKPVPLMSKIIGFSTGRTVLDPYAGSGSTLVAAKMLGLQSTGIEIEEKYCEIAAKRLQEINAA